MMGDEDGESKQETVRMKKTVEQANRIHLPSCFIRGETKKSVLPWKDAPSIWTGLQQNFSATDIQTGRDGIGNPSALLIQLLYS